MTSNLAAVFRVEDELLAPHADVYGPDPDTRLHALATALASSDPWHRLAAGDARLAIRPSSGLVAILARVGEEGRAPIEGVAGQVRDSLARLLPVPWREVEQACLELADRIRGELSESELRQCRITPVPRGGYVVAGLVAYALGVDRSRVGADGEGPMIVIDDCAVSGRRLTDWLRANPATEVIVATLHAVPELVATVEAREPNLRRWLTARSLTDHAAGRPDHDAWRRAWTERDPSAAWIGMPDHVVYPWNEPDIRLWNEAAHRNEAAWHVVPPAWCLKNRRTAWPGDIAVCPAGIGPDRPAENVIWAAFDADTAVLARAGDPSATVLRGTAARFWDAVVTGGDVGAAAAGDRELEGLASALAERGYLARR